MMQPTLPLADPFLNDALARVAPGLSAHDAVPLSGGRTNHVWKLGGFVVKIHDPAGASPLFPNDPKAEARALRLFAPKGLCPRLRAEGQGWLISDHVPAHAPAASPAAIARLLHQLHQQVLPEAAFRALPNGSSALIAHGRSFAPDGLPPPPPDPHLPPIAPCPVHADVVPGNILPTASGAVLIDWQCPGLGDPSEDLATLLSPAMMWLYTGQKHPEGWSDAVLDAYPDPHIADRTRRLLPIFRWRIMAHCAWKAARGDLDYATAFGIERDVL